MSFLARVQAKPFVSFYGRYVLCSKYTGAGGLSVTGI